MVKIPLNDEVLKLLKWAIRSQAPKFVTIRIWRRFRDYNGMGLRKYNQLSMIA